MPEPGTGLSGSAFGFEVAFADPGGLGLDAPSGRAPRLSASTSPPWRRHIACTAGGFAWVMKANYGFTCKMTAKPGMGDQLVKLLLTGLDEGNPGSTEWCVVYLVSRSASDPDVVTVQEGWTTEEDHHRIFGGAAAQAIVAQFADILAGEPTYADLIAVDGKANF